MLLGRWRRWQRLNRIGQIPDGVRAELLQERYLNLVCQETGKDRWSKPTAMKE